MCVKAYTVACTGLQGLVGEYVSALAQSENRFIEECVWKAQPKRVIAPYLK